MKYATSIEEYLDSKVQWKDALLVLRQLFQSTELEEHLKWGMPTYTLDRKNVAGFSAFNHFVAIWFHQGVFLSDPGKKLLNAQEGITRAQRQWRFTSLEDVENHRELILRYLKEAIRNQKDGKEMKPEREKALLLPRELEQALEDDPVLKGAFSSLSPGKQREYAAHIAQAKREETRHSRIEKIHPLILKGAGLYDQYK